MGHCCRRMPRTFGCTGRRRMPAPGAREQGRRTWALPTVTARSRDNFPNPIASPDSPYVPTNSPALDDLMSMFTFPVQ